MLGTNVVSKEQEQTSQVATGTSELDKVTWSKESRIFLHYAGFGWRGIHSLTHTVWCQQFGLVVAVLLDQIDMFVATFNPYLARHLACILSGSQQGYSLCSCPISLWAGRGTVLVSPRHKTALYREKGNVWDSPYVFKVRKQGPLEFVLLCLFTKFFFVKAASSGINKVFRFWFLALLLTITFCTISASFWPQCLCCGPLQWSSHAAPGSCPSCHQSCSSSVIGLLAPRSSWRTPQIWPCMELLTVHDTVGWRRKLLLQCEDSLLARNCGNDRQLAGKGKTAITYHQIWYSTQSDSSLF